MGKMPKRLKNLKSVSNAVAEFAAGPTKGEVIEIWFQGMVHLRFAVRNDSPGRPSFSVSGLAVDKADQATMGAAGMRS